MFIEGSDRDLGQILQPANKSVFQQHGLLHVVSYMYISTCEIYICTHELHTFICDGIFSNVHPETSEISKIMRTCELGASTID